MMMLHPREMQCECRCCCWNIFGVAIRIIYWFLCYMNFESMWHFIIYDFRYEQAELIERELEHMTEQIKSIINTLNATQGGELEATDGMTPLDVVVRILNNQLSSLMWIDEKVRFQPFAFYISSKWLKQLILLDHIIRLDNIRLHCSIRKFALRVVVVAMVNMTAPRFFEIETLEIRITVDVCAYK